MKILIGLTRSDTVVSGSHKHICQIGERFRKEKAEVVYALGGSKDNIGAFKLRNSGFKVYSLKHLKRNLSFINDLESLFALIWLIIKEKPDICSWHTAKIGALGRIASYMTGCKSYYIPHGVPFVNTPENSGYKVYEKLERILSFLPSKIISVCQFDKNEYLRIGVDRKRLLVIPNGMPGNAVHKNKNRKYIKFITAARFEAQKDYITLSKACRKLSNNELNYKLDIYGDGQQEDEIRQLFSKLPDGVVNFKGVVDNFEEKLIEADVFVLSSFWEGLPRSIIEAMGCHKPVIGSNVGGVCELIQHEKTGYLIPPRDSEAMYQSMSTYITNYGLHKKHGANAYKYYVDNYTLEMMLDNYIKEYLPSGHNLGGVVHEY